MTMALLAVTFGWAISVGDFGGSTCRQTNETKISVLFYFKGKKDFRTFLYLPFGFDKPIKRTNLYQCCYLHTHIYLNYSL